MEGKSCSVAELYSGYKRRLSRYHHSFVWLNKAENNAKEMETTADDLYLIHVARDL